MTTKNTISAASLKSAMGFVVTVNSLNRPNEYKPVAAFAHPSDAQNFADARRGARADLTYRIVAQ